MQTTLRIRDELYRKVKAKAASEGLSMTQLFEQALQMRLLQNEEERPLIELPTYRSQKGVTLTPKQIKAMQLADETWHDRKVLKNK